MKLLAFLLSQRQWSNNNIWTRLYENSRDWGSSLSMEMKDILGIKSSGLYRGCLRHWFLSCLTLSANRTRVRVWKPPKADNSTQVAVSQAQTRDSKRSENVWEVIEPLVRIIGKDLHLHKTSTQRKERHCFFQMPKSKENLQGIKETENHGAIKGTK